MEEPIIGIDLGTTNSEVAVVQNGQPIIIPNADGSKLLPSVVGVTETGTVMVGTAARNQYVLYPEWTVKSIKRRMGQPDKVSLAADEYSPQEISGIILKELKKIAETHLGRSVNKAVITVPAYFNDAQRQATREAGEIAGLEVVRMINEPTAAALSYEAGHHGSKRILVYDLGGGTFDVSVVRIEEAVVEVISSHGNNHLGGDDFDQKIVDHIVQHLQSEHDVDVTTAPKIMARIIRAAEGAKIHLSNNPYARIEEEYLLDKTGQPIHLSLELKRDEYEKMITPFIDETLEAVHTALRGAGLTVSEIEQILLVGGATRTPMVSRRLEEVFGVPPRGEVDPDLCVALGAAIQGASIAGDAVSAVLVDITPYTFGTSCFGELDGLPSPDLFVPVIAKNTPIPVKKSEVFYTMADNQESVDVRIYQGEHRDARRNTELGQFWIRGLGNFPANNPIVMDFSLDLNGILHVAAREKNTGLEKRITIDNAFAGLDDQKMIEARERIGTLMEDVPVVAANQEDTAGSNDRQATVQARALIEKAERMLERAEEEDRDEMIDLIEEINDALANGDDSALKTATSQLADVLYYLET